MGYLARIKQYFAEPAWDVSRSDELLKECPLCFELVRARASRCKWCTGNCA